MNERPMGAAADGGCLLRESEGARRVEVAFIIGKMKGGGVEATALAYLKYTDSCRLHITFVVDDDSSLIPEEQIRAYGGDLVLVPPYQHQIQYQKALRHLFHERHFDVVHSHVSTMSVFPLYAAAKAGIPVRIVHAHSTAGRGETAKNIMKYTLRPFARVFATDCVACSVYAGKWMFGRSAPFTVLPNAIDFEWQNYAFNATVREKKRRELGLNGMLVIGHVGRFIPQKNHAFLIDVFAEVHKREERSVCILVGTGALEEQIRGKVRSLGLEDSVRFLGQREDADELYQAMDIFVMPSLYEGMPLVGMEAQAAGMPCVISDVVTKEVDLGGSVDFLPMEEGPARWAERVLQLASDRLRERREAVSLRKGYDASAEGRALEDHYMKLVRVRRGGYREETYIILTAYDADASALGEAA